jgi:hypothetical protein
MEKNKTTELLRIKPPKGKTVLKADGPLKVLHLVFDSE